MNISLLRRVSKLTIFVLFWMITIGWTSAVHAAAVSSVSDTMSRLKISTLSNHEIKFVTPTGVDSSTDTITLEFDSTGTDFGLSTIVFGDIDLEVGSSNNCTTAVFTDKTLAAAPGAGAWGASINTTTDIITLTAPTDAAVGEITADRCIKIKIGTNANTPASGTNQITNPATAASYTVVIGGTFGDSGSLAVGIVNNDQATVTADISPSLTFDVDSGTTQGVDNNGPHTLALSTLSASTLTTSDQNVINSIFIDLATNATYGASVTVVGVNGGLTSTAADPDKTITLGSAEGTITAGVEGFGLCVESVAQTAGGPFTPGTQYDSGGSLANCTAGNGGTPTVGRVETTPTEILNTSAEPLSGGRAEILLKAAVSATTPAASDYSETLTFIASGTF